MKFGLERYNNIKELTRVLNNYLSTLDSRISSLESQSTEALNTRLTSAESTITTLVSAIALINSQLPQSISDITGLGDFIKVGTVTNNTDNNQTFIFPTAFTNGTDSDIRVFLNRVTADGGTELHAQNVTKTSFDIDRQDAISGTDTVFYLAINGSYL